MIYNLKLSRFSFKLFLFTLFYSFIHGRDLEIRSVPTALNTLYVAHKYLVPGLVKNCGEYLNAALQPDTVLEVYARVRLCCPDVRSPSPTESTGEFGHQTVADTLKIIS